MARPARYNADYYTHDADLRNDRRVKAIRVKFGAAGYGILHMLLEAMTNADHTQLATDSLELELLAGDFGVPDTEISSLIQFAERIGYFVRNNADMIVCPDLNRWLEPVFDKRTRSKATALSGGKSNALWLKHTEEVFARDKNQCVYCQSPNDLTLDHIIPQIAGGSDEPENLQTLCTSCNSKKGALLPESVTETTQSKVKESRVEKSKGGGGGVQTPSPPPISENSSTSLPIEPAPAPPSSAAPPVAKPVEAKVPADEAPIFQRQNFSAYLATVEESFGKLNVGHYLTAIQRRAEDARPAERTNRGWQDFIFKYLTNDLKDDNLIRLTGKSRTGPVLTPNLRFR